MHAAVSVFALTALLSFAALASAQSVTLNYNNGDPYPVIFDDFHYTEEASSWSVSNGRMGIDGSIFGVNPWFVGTAPGGVLTPNDSRSWYGPGAFGREHAPTMASLFNETNWDLTTTELLGNVILRGEEGPRDATFAPRGPRFHSGFAAQTGTWVARFAIPDYDGLVHHDPLPIECPPPGDGFGLVIDEDEQCEQNIDLILQAAFWTYGVNDAYLDNTHSEYSWQTSPECLAGGYCKSWDEFNVEWRNYFAAEGNSRSMNPGVSVAHQGFGEHASAIPDGHQGERNPVMTNGPLPQYPDPNHPDYPPDGDPTGSCYVQLVEGGGFHREYNSRWCFDAFTGNLHGPTYIYFMIQITPTSTQYRTYVTKNDRLNPSGTPAFHYVAMASSKFQNFISPHHMMAWFSYSFIRLPRHRGDDNVPERKDMIVDWFMYTPTTDHTIWDYVGDAKNIQAQLLQEGSGITRANTTGLALDAPYVLAEHESDNCAWGATTCDPCTNLPMVPTKPPYFDVEMREHNGSVYLSPQFLRDGTYDLRSGTWSFEWNLQGEIQVNPTKTFRVSHHAIYDGFNLALSPDLLDDINYYHIEATGSIHGNKDGVEEVTERFPICARVGANATPTDSVIVRNYTLFPRDGILLEGTHPYPPPGNGANQVPVANSLIAGGVLTLRSFPNPAADVATIEVETSGPVLFDIKVYDVLGRLVAQIPQEMSGPGLHRLPIDTARFAAGTYMLVVETETGRISARIAITR